MSPCFSGPLFWLIHLNVQTQGEQKIFFFIWTRVKHDLELNSSTEDPFAMAPIDASEDY